MRHSILKKGYLNHQLEIFYILDRDLPVFQFHYHDFYKLLIHLRVMSPTRLRDRPIIWHPVIRF